MRTLCRNCSPRTRRTLLTRRNTPVWQMQKPPADDEHNNHGLLKNAASSKDAAAKGMTDKAIAMLFPTRTVGGVAIQRDALHQNGDLYGKNTYRRIRTWSPDGINLLQKLYDTNGLQRFKLLAHFPDRSLGAVTRAITLYCLSPRGGHNSGSSWTDEEDKRLTEFAQSTRKSEIAEALGRSIPAIEQRAATLGIQFLSASKVYTAEEVAVVLQMRRDKVTYKDIAAELGRKLPRSLSSAHYYRHRPLQDGDTKRQKPLRDWLSLEELESISNLRAQGVSWPDIGH